MSINQEIKNIFDQNILTRKNYKFIYDLIFAMQPDVKMTVRKNDTLFNLKELEEKTSELILKYIYSLY